MYRAQSPVSTSRAENIYSSLPHGLTQELLVRSKEVFSEDEARRRQALVREKSPAQLAQMHSFAEIPVPRKVEQWIRGEDDE